MTNNLGYNFTKQTEEEIQLTRTTRESKIDLSIKKSDRDSSISTGIDFLNHMIETISWRSGFKIDIKFTIDGFKLDHVICEDSGIVIGRAFKEYIKANMNNGLKLNNGSISGIDEAMTICNLSFEGRSNTFIDKSLSPGANREQVEKVSSDDMEEFFNGFSQGSGATINLKFMSGNNPHHAWEAAFRTFGECLKNCLTKVSNNSTRIPGVKGTLE